MYALSDLPINKECIIKDIIDPDLKQRLLEMGCIPGEKIKITRSAPFNGPIAVLISNFTLSLRKEDAKNIQVDFKKIEIND